MNTDKSQVELASIDTRLPAKDTFRILFMDTVEHTDQLKKACKDAGHDVVTAHSIDEAFAFLDGEDHADVIVCAAHLEDESMFEFLKRLRADATHDDSTFMILALAPGPVGFKANNSAQNTGRLLGADMFVSMPVFDAPLLIAELKKLLPTIPKAERSKQEFIADDVAAG